MSMGCFRQFFPRARILMPSLTLPTRRLSISSLGVICWVGSIRPWLIQSCSLTRLTSDSLSARLLSLVPQSKSSVISHDIHIVETLPAVLDNQRCLSTLEPRLDLSMLALTLVTPPRRLAMARRRTTANTLPILDGALVVPEVAQDRGMARLDREAGEAGRQ